MGHEIQQSLSERTGYALPCPSLVRRLEITLDILLILLQRQQSSQHREKVYRYAWSDSSPIGGFEWLWSQYHEILQANVIETYRAVVQLQRSIAWHVASFSEDGLHAVSDAWLPEWMPMLETNSANIREHINPPVALGSGHRGAL
jgi:hypothetical protein